jgi:hypothetical protein
MPLTLLPKVLPFNRLPRPPRQKQMTAIIGFINGQSAILCADSLELVGEYSKASVQKIHTTTYYKKYRLAVGGAAQNAIYLDLFEKRLNAHLAKVTEYDYSKITKAIEKALLEVHKKHIWPKQLDNQFQSLIVIQGIDPPCRSLVVTQETTLLAVDGYKTIGAGADMADYLRSVLFPGNGDVYNAPTEILVNAGIFMIAEIKKHIPYVERETRVTVFDGITGEIDWKSTSSVALSEMWMNHLQQAELGLRHMVMSPTMTDGDWEVAWNQFKFQIEHLRGGQKNYEAGHPILCPPFGWIRKITPLSPPEEKPTQSASRKSAGRR